MLFIVSSSVQCVSVCEVLAGVMSLERSADCFTFSIEANFGHDVNSYLEFMALQTDERRAEKYSARNRLIKDLTDMNMTFDHFGTCKFGTEAYAATLPEAQKEEWGYHSHSIEGQRRKVQIQKHYKFQLGLENTIEMDYMTEKFYHMFATR